MRRIVDSGAGINLDDALRKISRAQAANAMMKL